MTVPTPEPNDGDRPVDLHSDSRNEGSRALTPDLDAIREWHLAGEGYLGDRRYCIADAQIWPCETATLLALVDSQRSEIGVARAAAESWRDSLMASDDWTLRIGAHPLAMVIAALAGETDPVHLALDATSPAGEHIRGIVGGVTT